MKKTGLRILLLLLAVCLLPLKAEAYMLGDPWNVELDMLMDDTPRREYAEMMLDYHLRNNTAVQQTLEEGFCALFFFDGCSDNMDDPDLQDLSYYRVTGICIGVRLDEKGEPGIFYFNENCSTIPDRPLEYGAWSVPEVGDVGPATICDGTFEIYSVKHMGKYEALHMRDSLDDGELEAIYMTPDGHVRNDADMINIHTRTSNHTSGVGMWSAGCMLVGDGDFRQFQELMDSTFYSLYNTFEIGWKVGTVTIDRILLQDAMLELYGSESAVETILLQSRCVQPEIYRKQCGGYEAFSQGIQLQTARVTAVMTLPCTNYADARSRVAMAYGEGEVLTLTGRLENTRGEYWYTLEHNGTTAYIQASDMEPVAQKNWLETLWDRLFGK